MLVNFEHILSVAVFNNCISVASSFSLFLCLGNFCSLQGCLFMCAARSWFVEVVLLQGLGFCSQGVILSEVNYFMSKLYFV